MDIEAELYLTFDMLGDLRRSGSVQWEIDRFRLSDIKDHVFDLIILTKLIKPYIPNYINTDKMIDYAIVHDFEEIITGDITTYEGISKEEKERVNKIAQNYLIKKYGNIMNIKKISQDYENKVDIESKVLKLLDKTCSIYDFLKYDHEKKVDMDNPKIIKCLRCNEEVVKLKEQGYGLGEVFYIIHMRSIKFSEEEIIKYNISKEDADKIICIIKELVNSIKEKIETIETIENDFPKEARIYRYVNEKHKEEYNQ